MPLAVQNLHTFITNRGAVQQRNKDNILIKKCLYFNIFCYTKNYCDKIKY